MTVPYDTMISLTYDLLPICPSSAFLQDSHTDLNYEENLLFLTNQALKDFLMLFKPEVLSLTMTLKVYLTFYFLEKDVRAIIFALRKHID